MLIDLEGHNTGGPTNSQQDPHRSPPDIDDGSSEGTGDQHGRGHNHVDHVTQLQAQSQKQPPTQQATATVEQMANVRGVKKMNIDKDITLLQRRGQKRRLRNDSSGTSEEEEPEEVDKIAQQIAPSQHRNAAQSPTSSSCHSTIGPSPVATASAVNIPASRIPIIEPITVSPKTTLTHDDNEVTATSTSVKDLEHAMSKHLPSNMISKTNSPPLATTVPTDFSTDALLKQQQRSTIQWIGAHHHLNHLNHQHQLQQAQSGASSATAPLPASALLRQLYANRESVIRANVTSAAAASVNSRAPSGGGAPSGTGPSYYATDVQVGQMGPLPTPPGSEGSSTYSEHQFMLAQHQKPTNGPDAFSSLVSYSTAGTYSMDYHSAMTPPSSVSPRDKHQQLHGGVAFDGPAVYSDVLRHQYLGAGDSPAQPLPLKPQVYSAMHPSALDAAAAAYVASSPLDQSQFYHHSATSAGFHLYHPGNKGPAAAAAAAAASVYPDALKNTSNWYSSS